MPVIRVDKDVWQWLQSNAVPLVDTPNSVLRRVAGLDKAGSEASVAPNQSSSKLRGTASSQGGESMNGRRSARNSGKALNQLWGVGAQHALYHWEGKFYENLTEFPGALFDDHGYVRFRTPEEYEQSPYLSIGEKLNVRGTISQIPGYVRKN